MLIEVTEVTDVTGCTDFRKVIIPLDVIVSIKEELGPEDETHRCIITYNPYHITSIRTLESYDEVRDMIKSEMYWRIK